MVDVTPELIAQMENFVTRHQRTIAGAVVQNGQTVEQLRIEIRGQEDWIRNAYIRLSEAEKKTKAAETKAQTIAKDIESQLRFIADYPGVAKVQFSNMNGRMFIDTELLDLDCPDGTTRRVGVLRIRVDLNGALVIHRRSWGTDMVRHPGVPTMALTRQPHPHVNEAGNPCWGDAAQGVAVFGAEGHYDMLVAQVMEYLKQVNADDQMGMTFKNFPLAPGSGPPNWEETRNHDDPEFNHRWCEPQLCDVVHGTDNPEDHRECDEQTCWYLRHNNLGEHDRCLPDNCTQAAHRGGLHMRCRPDICADARLTFHEANDHGFCLREDCEVASIRWDHGEGNHARCRPAGCGVARAQDNHENGDHTACRPGRCDGARQNRHDGGRHDYCRPANCEVIRRARAGANAVAQEEAAPGLNVDYEHVFNDQGQPVWRAVDPAPPQIRRPR